MQEFNSKVSETCLTISQRKPSDTAENHTTLIDKRKRDLSGLLVADYIGLATSRARATHVMLTLSWKKEKKIELRIWLVIIYYLVFISLIFVRCM